MQMTGVLAKKGLRALDTAAPGQSGRAIPRIWAIAIMDENARIYRKAAQGMEDIMQASALNHDFITRLADWLDTIEREQVFDRLVLVAEPEVLEKLRSALSQNVCTRVAAEVEKNLSGMTENEVKRCLDEVVWF